MPLFTRPHFSDKQIVQFSGETITLSGITNFDGVLKSKGIEIDATVSNPSIQNGFVLKFEEATNRIILLPDDSGVAGLSNAQNGLGVIGNTVVLGGTLLSGTTININGFPFVLTGGTLSLQDLEIQGIGIDTTPVNNTQNLYLKYNSGTNKFEPAELVVPDTITAENGLTKINNVIVLGGELNQATTINQLGFPLVFTGDTVFLQALNIDGVGIELKPVNNTQNLYLKYNSGTNKFEPAQLVIPNNITASNGISKVGDDIRLGGTLNEATTIQQSGFPLLLTGGTVGIQRLEVQGIEIDATPVNNTQNLFLKYNSSQTKFEPSVIDYSDIVNTPPPVSQLTANNGLSITGDTIQLGGSLVKDTDINVEASVLSLSKDIVIAGFDVGQGFNSTLFTPMRILGQPDGKVIVGGSFTTYNLTTFNRIIRLNSDGSIDNTFSIGTGFDNNVNTLALQSDGKIIAGGVFSNYNGNNRNFIVRINSDGSIDSSFNIGTGFNAIVNVIKIQSDGKILVGGQFTSYNSTTYNRIIRLNSDGSVDNSFTIGAGFDNFVESMSIQSDGKILAGGLFTSYDSNTRNRIIRLNSDGSIDNTFVIGGGFNGQVDVIEIQSDGKILAGGQFTSYNSTTYNNIIRLNSDGSVDGTFNIGTGIEEINFLFPLVFEINIQSDGKIIVGGFFTGYDSNTSNCLLRLNSDGSFDNNFNVGSGFGDSVSLLPIVYDSLLTENGLVVVGNFDSYNNNTYNSIVGIDANGAILPLPSDVTIQLLFNEKLANYKENYHDLYDDRTLVDKEYVDNSLENILQNISFENGITAIDNVVSLGGSLVKDTKINLTLNHKISISKPVNFSVFDVGTGFNGGVFSAALQSDGKIVLVGNFTSYNSVIRNGIVRLNSDGSIDNSFDVGSGFDNEATDVAIDDNNKIIVIGQFSTYNSVTVSQGIVKLNPDGTIDSSFNGGTGFVGLTDVIKLQSDGKILVGGLFTSYNSTTSNRIIRLNSDGSIDNTFNIGSGFDDAVYDIEIQSDGKILVGGEFASYNSTTSNRIIRLNFDGSIDTSFIVGTGFGGNIIFFVERIRVQANGKILVGGRFTSYQTTFVNGIIRLNSDGSVDATFNSGTGINDTADVYDIEVSFDNKITLVGNFESYNSITANRIIRLNNEGSVDTTFNSGTGFTGSQCRGILRIESQLLCYNGFTAYNSIPRERIALINEDGSLADFKTNDVETIFDEKLANYKENYHDLYDDRTLVDKEYVDIKVFNSINDNFQLSGATNGMALVFNSGTTKYQPSFVDYNTLLNLPIPTTYGNTAFVSPAGNNTTAIVGRFDRPYATIQQAVNAASANGSICIVEGTYSESLTINKQLKFTSLGRVQISGTHTITSTTVEFDNIRLKQASVAAIFTASSSTITLKNLEVDTAGSFVASATGTSTIIARNVYSNKNLTNGTFTNERPFNFAVDGAFTI